MDTPKRRNKDPVGFLNAHIYPTLNIALNQLIERLISSNEVQKYQERLKEQKFLDKLEQKKMENQRLKEEYGSDYVSSEESLELGQYGERNDDSSFEQDPNNIPTSDQEFKVNVNGANADNGLQIIAEDDREEPVVKAKPKIENRVPRDPVFNPIEFLAKALTQVKQKQQGSSS
eukprot:TRINITY_DN2027_c0_g1_i13.p1 TRINITY_DN2027_c0_g1~~TRINITY_DN2027_c0_g1_i13.p1  ORF type:complete len:174 (-),score=34.29 TRINITY_DN2027_c0_g1_i13:228-749(-)